MTEFSRSPMAAAGDPFAQDPSITPSNTPMWREALAGLDWLSLHLSPTYLGCGIQRGHGEPVVVVPGFLGTDTYLIELCDQLGRIRDRMRPLLFQSYNPIIGGSICDQSCRITPLHQDWHCFPTRIPLFPDQANLPENTRPLPHSGHDCGSIWAHTERRQARNRDRV